MKRGEYRSEIIEEILSIAEMMMKKKDIIHMEEELANDINVFIINTKGKGFEGKVNKNKNEIFSDEIFVDWTELFK